MKGGRKFWVCSRRTHVAAKESCFRREYFEIHFSELCHTLWDVLKCEDFSDIVPLSITSGAFLGRTERGAELGFVTSSVETT